MGTSDCGAPVIRRLLCVLALRRAACRLGANAAVTEVDDCQRTCGPTGAIRGADLASGFELGGLEPAEIERQAQRRGAAPYNVQRHDCRGIIAATGARVHTIGPS